jgi:hypothetical protein
MNEQLQPPKGAPLFNPWSPDFIANPYPHYHRLREADPMHLTPSAFMSRVGTGTSRQSFGTNGSGRTSLVE